MVRCRNCGTETPEGSVFCTNCGQKLKEAKKKPVGGIVAVVICAAIALAIGLTLTKKTELDGIYCDLMTESIYLDFYTSDSGNGMVDVYNLGDLTRQGCRYEIAHDLLYIWHEDDVYFSRPDAYIWLEDGVHESRPDAFYNTSPYVKQYTFSSSDNGLYIADMAFRKTDSLGDSAIKLKESQERYNSSDDVFIPDYEDGQQNTEWGNSPGNMIFNPTYVQGNIQVPSSIALQDGYLYYSFGRTNYGNHLYKMPVNATSAEEVSILVNSQEAKLHGAIMQIQVLGDWIYFSDTRDNYGTSIYRVRTDGSGLELLYSTSEYYYTGFVVHKDRLYFTVCRSENITATTYEDHSMLLSIDVTTGDVRAEFDLPLYGYSGHRKAFDIYTYDPNGYIIIRSPETDSGSEWLIYSLEDGSISWNSPTPEGTPEFLQVAPNGNVYFRQEFPSEFYYCESSVSLQNPDAYTRISEEKNEEISNWGYAAVADENGLYFAGRSGICYYDREQDEVREVCPDGAEQLLLPGDGYLYYKIDRRWCRIATENGSPGTDWEYLDDWMYIAE